MSLLERFREMLAKDPPPAAVPAAYPSAAATIITVSDGERLSPIDRARYDVRRFKLAIEQCVKGPERLRVLEADLAEAEARLAALKAAERALAARAED